MLQSSARRVLSNAEDLAQRALHLHITPRPWNFSESRSVLRVLQQFGEVVYYRNLRHETDRPAANKARIIFSTVEAATKARAASPIRFSLEPISISNPGTPISTPSSYDTGDHLQEDAISDVLSAHVSRTPRPPLPSDAPPPFPFEEPSSPYPTAEDAPLRHFDIIAMPVKINLQENVLTGPYWNRFEIGGGLAQRDLEAVVPLRALSEISQQHSLKLEDRMSETNWVEKFGGLRALMGKNVDRDESAAAMEALAEGIPATTLKWDPEKDIIRKKDITDDNDITDEKNITDETGEQKIESSQRAERMTPKPTIWTMDPKKGFKEV